MPVETSRSDHPVLRRTLRVGLPAVAVLVLVVVVAATVADRRGRNFLACGRQAVAALERTAAALAADDPQALERTLDPAFSGHDPGFADFADAEAIDQRDGVEIFRARPASPDAPPLDRQDAVATWMRYLEGFDSIESVELHVVRIERWSTPEDPDGVTAIARFELIGTPAGAPRAGIDRAHLRVRFAPDPSAEDGRMRIVGIEPLASDPGTRVIARKARFVNVAEPAGVAFENRYYPGFLDRPLAFPMIRYGPAGITAADVDGDGFEDLFIPDGVASRLFHNRGDGTFEDVTEAAGLAGLSGVSVGLFADYDDDGVQDLFVSRTFEPNQLFHGDGDGAFTDVTERSGLGADCCTTVASWADIDNDGDLDLYVGRYIDPRKRIPTTFYARNGEPNRLYENDGDGTFTDVTDHAGVGDTGLCLGTAFGDYDDDGWPDLWVANDFGRKTLYHNRGDGTFEDVTVESGTLAYGAGMSASFGDYDNDGRLDLYVAHIRSEHAWFAEAPTVYRYMVNSFRQGVWTIDMPLYFEIFRQSGGRLVEVFQQMASGNTLLHNRGDGTFEDTTWQAAANPPGWFWGSGFADFDNDGWLDIYSANGWVYGEPDTEIELDFLNDVVAHQDVYKSGVLFDPEHFAGRSWHGWERNRHLRNDRDGTFTEIGRALGTDLLRNSRGIAVADFWNRGALDIAVAASTDRHALLVNRGGDGSGEHWLEVEVVGAGRDLPDGTNRDGVGVRLTLEAGGLRQIREVTLGDGYGSQNSLRQHFGLGGSGRIRSLTVRWPRSGRVQTFHDVAADRIVRVTEGRDAIEEPAYPRAPIPSSSGDPRTPGDPEGTER